MRKLIEAQVNEISRLDLMKENKAKYDYVQSTVDKYVKDKVDKAITNSLILRWIKGRNWEGGLGSGRDTDRMWEKLMSEYNLDADDIYDRFQNLCDYWEKLFKKAGITESLVIEASEKPLSKMNTTELRDYAVSLGADKKDLYGTSKQSLIIIINQIQKDTKPVTYSVVRLVDVGDFSSDKMELGEVKGTVLDIKKNVSKKYGPVKSINHTTREVIVESKFVVDYNIGDYYCVWHKGQRNNGKLFKNYDDAVKFAKKKVNNLKSANMNMPVNQREVYISQGDNVLDTFKVKP